MPNVVIRRLHVRVVRSRSLFWGDDPRALVRRALAMVAAAIEARLAALAPDDDGDIALTAPVHVVIPVRQSRRLGTPTLIPDQAELVAAIDEALAPALAQAVPARPGKRTVPAPPRDLPLRSVLGELLPLYHAGELPARLAHLDPGTVEAYHRILLVERPATVEPPRPVSPAELVEAETFIEALAAGFSAARAAGDRPALLRARLVAAIGLAAQTGIHPFDPAVRALFDRHMPLATNAAATELPSDIHAAAAPPRAPVQAHTGAKLEARAATDRPSDVSRPPSPHAPSRERAVAVLPLVCAGLLQRRGALDTIAARLPAEELPLVVAALALKLSPPPWRGWHHDQAVWDAAAAAAGLELLSPESLVLLADDARADWDGLARELAGALPADPAPTDALDLLAALADRPAAPRARAAGFDQMVTTCAAWALAHVAGRLWPDEPGGGLLALERLGSLEARATRGDDGLRVLVPLGKRHADLSRAGLLADLSRAAWLRTPLAFRGG